MRWSEGEHRRERWRAVILGQTGGRGLSKGHGTLHNRVYLSDLVFCKNKRLIMKFYILQYKFLWVCLNINDIFCTCNLQEANILNTDK